MKRSCQRHTEGLDTPARRMISAVPTAIRRRQDDPRPPHMFLAAVAIRHDPLQTVTVRSTHLDLDPLAHGTAYRKAPAEGIL